MQILIDNLKKLELQIRNLEISQEKRIDLNTQILQHVDKFLADLPTSPAYTADFNTEHASADFAISETPIEMSKLLQTMEKHIEKPGVNTTSGNYFGYIPSGGLYPAALGDYLSAVINRYSSLFFMAPGAVEMEKKLIRWAAQLIGFPDTSFGNITSGGSLATLVAIVTARFVKKINVANCKSRVVYSSPHTHYCLVKALHLAGLNEIVQRIVPLDESYRMDISSLKTAIETDIKNGLTPCMIVATAGTTDTGAIDPLEAIHAIAEQYNTWLHIDAAYGGFFMLTEQGKKLLSGLRLADSVVLDAHKSLFMPYGIALVLIKDHQNLLQAHRYTAHYLQDAPAQTEIYSAMNLSPELTRPFRGLRMWLSLQLLGVNYFRMALEEKLLLANYFYKKMAAMPNIEIACEPHLSIVTFRCVAPEVDPELFNTQLYLKLLKDGTIFLSTTTINHKYYLRFACLSIYSHLENVDLAIHVLTQKIQELSEQI